MCSLSYVEYQKLLFSELTVLILGDNLTLVKVSTTVSDMLSYDNFGLTLIATLTVSCSSNFLSGSFRISMTDSSAIETYFFGIRGSF